jgi:hypothetical protein
VISEILLPKARHVTLGNPQLIPLLPHRLEGSVSFLTCLPVTTRVTCASRSRRLRKSANSNPVEWYPVVNGDVLVIIICTVQFDSSDPDAILQWYRQEFWEEYYRLRIMDENSS